MFTFFKINVTFNIFLFSLLYENVLNVTPKLRYIPNREFCVPLHPCSRQFTQHWEYQSAWENNCIMSSVAQRELCQITSPEYLSFEKASVASILTILCS